MQKRIGLKKIMSIVLAMALIFSRSPFSAVAFAEDDPPALGDSGSVPETPENPELPAEITFISDAFFSCVAGKEATFEARTEGAENVSYTLDGSEPEGVSIDAATGVLTIAETVPAGEYPFVVEAIDADRVASPATQEFVLTVEEGAVLLPRAAGIHEVSTPEEFGAAVAALADGETIKLLADIEYRETLSLIGISITIDLGGHTLNIVTNNNYGLHADGANLYLANEGAGGLHVKNNYSDATCVYATNGSSVAVSSAVSTSNYSTAVYADSGSQVTVNGDATAGAHAVEAAGTGTKVVVNGDARADKANYASVVFAGSSAEVEVFGDAYGVITGAHAESGAKVYVQGNIIGSGMQFQKGVYAKTGGEITIDGEIKTSQKTFNIDETLLYLGEYPQVFPTTKTGYFTYTMGGASTVWIKATPPIVSPYSPGAGQTVPITTSEYIIKFNYAMDPTKGNLSIAGGSGATLTNPVWSDNNKTVTYQLAGLIMNQAYFVTISGFADPDGNTMVQKTVNFYTQAPERLTVTFEANGGTPQPAAQSVPPGDRAYVPAPMTRDGYGFAGWYNDPAFSGIPFSFNTPITASMTLYAKWLENSEFACSIGETKYTTLDKALEYAQSGDTIKLLGNIDRNGNIHLSRQITFDLNGFTLNVFSTVVGHAGISVGAGGAVYLTGEGALNATGHSFGAYAMDGGTITVTNATATGPNGSGVEAIQGGAVAVRENASGNSGVYTYSGGNAIVSGDVTGTVISDSGSNATVYGDVYSTDTFNGAVMARGENAVIHIGGNVVGASAGARATEGGQITVVGSVTGNEDGVSAWGEDSQITIHGDIITATEGFSRGASSYEGGCVTVDGTITASYYVSVYGRDNIGWFLYPGDETLPTTKPGYNTYCRDWGSVWVKIDTNLTLDSIELVTPPDKTRYDETEVLDTTGMQVMAHYTNGSQMDVTDQVTVGPNRNDWSSGEQELTVSYTENGITKTATFLIDVEIVITDEAFRNNVLDVLQLTPYDPIFQYDLDGITELNLTSLGIQDLGAVSYFRNLELLSCNDNNLTTLDLSSNPKLTWLDCGSNNLTSVNVSNNLDLDTFSCSQNNLSSIDISNNTKLTYLNCSINYLTSLDLSQNLELLYLYCGYNDLTSLDVSNNFNLYLLDCKDDNLQQLDVSNNTDLVYLYCQYNNLTELDLSANTWLRTLHCGNNPLVNLLLPDGVTPQGRMSIMSAGNNNLADLNCANGQLTSLDLSACGNLVNLDCSNNKLAVLDLAACVKLQTLKCGGNFFRTPASITGIDTSKLTTFDFGTQNPPVGISLTGISVSAPPQKTAYIAGETLDLNGLVILAGYSDGSSNSITGYTTTPAVSAVLTASDTLVTVSYTEGDVTKTTDFAITVTEPAAPVLTGIEVTTLPVKTTYTVGDKLDLDGIIVTASYDIGGDKVITAYTTNPANGATLNTAGTIPITVSFEGKTASFTVTVSEPVPVLTGIEVTTLPGKTTYTVGDKLDLTGMVVTASYDIGGDKTVTGYTTDPANGAVLNTAGTIPVAVSFEGKTASFDVTVSEPVPVLTGIEVTTKPSKTTYTVGDQLDLTGMVVTASYDIGGDKTVTGYTTDPMDGAVLSTAGTIPITVSFEGKTASFDVTVIEPVPVLTGIEVTTLPSKMNYTVGDKLDLDGIIVTASYDIGGDKVITAYTTNPAAGLILTAAGATTVTVSYEGKTASFTVAVNEPVPVLTGIEVKTLPSKTTYTVGDALDLTGIIVTASYDIGGVKTVTGYTADPMDGAILTSAGTIPVTVRFEGKTTSFDVTVSEQEPEPATLTGIEITAMPAKTSYLKDDRLDLAGMTISAVYSDGKKETITGYTTTPANGAKLKTVGTQTVTVSYKANGTTKKSTFTVLVTAPTEVKLSSTYLIVTEKKTTQLKATITPQEASKQGVTWSSSNTNIATVDQNGKITAIKEGSATITATANDGSGAKSTCTVSVIPPVRKIVKSIIAWIFSWF